MPQNVMGFQNYFWYEPKFLLVKIHKKMSINSLGFRDITVYTETKTFKDDLKILQPDQLF